MPLHVVVTARNEQEGSALGLQRYTAYDVEIVIPKAAPPTVDSASDTPESEGSRSQDDDLSVDDDGTVDRSAPVAGEVIFRTTCRWSAFDRFLDEVVTPITPPLKRLQYGMYLRRFDPKVIHQRRQFISEQLEVLLSHPRRRRFFPCELFPFDVSRYLDVTGPGGIAAGPLPGRLQRLKDAGIPFDPTCPPQLGIPAALPQHSVVLAKASSPDASRPSAVTSASADAPLAEVTHTVTRDDTLVGLAVRYGTSVGEIRRANRLISNDLAVFPCGHTLTIPARRIPPAQTEEDVARDDAAGKLARIHTAARALASVRPGVSQAEALAYLNAADGDLRVAMQRLLEDIEWANKVGAAAGSSLSSRPLFELSARNKVR